MYENIYEPQEDSYLMEKAIKKYLKNKSNLKITEVGVGSGFVFEEIIKTNPNNSYQATDINPDAIKSTKQRIKNIKSKIQIKKGNLLEPIKEKQNLIFFNTPYLPLEYGEKYENLTLKDKAIYGGKHGYEIIFQFINQLNEKLENNGSVFMLFSSYSKEKKIKEKLFQEGFEIKGELREKHFMEELIIYEIKKSKILQKLSSINIKDIKYLTKGKHSVIFKGKLKNKEIIAKCEDNSYIEKEAIFLDKLKKENFTPKIYHKEKGLIIMDFCKGLTIKEFLEKENNKNIIIKILDKCLKITHKLDQLNLQKFELTNPYKHIFIDDKLNIKFIDFERTIYSKNPKNTSQFLQYIKRNRNILEKKEILIDFNKILEIGKEIQKNKKIKIQLKSLI